MEERSTGPDTGTRVALGCAAAFVGLFGLVGLLTLVLAAASGQVPTAALAAPVLFIGVSIGGLLLIRWIWKQAALRERRKAEAPDQPWAWSQDMAGGVIKGGSARTGAIVLSVFAGFWVAVMGVITAFGWEKIREEPGLTAFMLLFWAAGLFLGTLAVRAILQAVRYPPATLALDAVPLPLGGWASGVMRAPLAVQGAEVEVGLECTRTMGTGKHRSTTTLWRETKVLDGNRFSRGIDAVDIPFAFRLPATLEATGESSHGTLSLFGGAVTLGSSADVDWYVSASAEVPGVDWEERFRVPVAAAQPGVVVDPSPPREMPLLTGERLDAHLPGRLEIGADADVLHFPVKPSFVLWPLACGSVALFLPLARAAPALSEVPGEVFFWVRVIAGVIALLCVVGLLFDPRRIEVRPDAVRIRRGLFGVGVHLTLPRAEVAAVDEKTSPSSPPLYLVQIRTRAGKSYGVAPSIHAADQAAALAARLRAILQVG